MKNNIKPINNESTGDDEPIKIIAAFDSIADVVGHLENIGFLLALIEERHIDRFGADQIITQIELAGRIIQTLSTGILFGLDEIGAELNKDSFDFSFELFEKAQDYLNPESHADRSIALISIRDRIRERYPNIQQTYNDKREVKANA